MSMQFEEFEAEDFVLEESFLNYCVGVNNGDMAFWTDWIAKHPEKHAAIKQAKEMYFVLNGNISSSKFRDDEREFRTIVEQYTATPRVHAEKTPGILRRLKIGAIAAAVAAAAVFIYFAVFHARQPAPATNEQLFSQVSKAGERKSFQLPDGSKVMLNAGSSLRLINNFTGPTRELHLDGEAFFDVAHNAEMPFIIHTGRMNVKVLGTAFNVKDYAGDSKSETSLIRGSVEISYGGSREKKVVLQPDQKFVIDERNAVFSTERKGKAEPGKPYQLTSLHRADGDSAFAEISWTQNKLIFSNDDFEDVAAALERWYAVKITFIDDEPKRYRFTAIFDQKNIDQVLEALKLSRGFKYKIEDNNEITISK